MITGLPVLADHPAEVYYRDVRRARKAAGDEDGAWRAGILEMAFAAFHRQPTIGRCEQAGCARKGYGGHWVYSPDEGESERRIFTVFRPRSA